MKNRTMKSIVKKVAAVCVAAAVIVTTFGCTVTEESVSQKKEEFTITDLQEGSQSSESTGSTGMGRYVEKTVLEQEGYDDYYFMQQLSEGSLLLLDNSKGLYLSEDNGDSWTLETKEWLEEFIYYNYIIASAVAKDGTMAFAYHPYTREELDTLHGTKTEDVAEETEEAQELVTEEPQFDTQYMIVSPEGTKTEFTMDLSEDELYVRNFCFTESGRLFAVVFGNKIYEIDLTDRSSRVVVSLEDSAQYVQNAGSVLLCMTYGGIELYDLEKGELIEDSVLDKFIQENYTDLCDNGNGYSVYAFLGKDNAVYLAGKKGLHRHVIGGSMVEQIVDGRLSSFSNPAAGLQCAMAIDNQEFLVKYSNHKLVKYSYDETVPTVPNERLTVYSLETNDTIKQAIVACQAANPELFIEYEVGMEADGITREDALKKLSTQLLNGSGPDVLILDHMPAEPYIDKGVLMELSDVIQDIGDSEELFTNLLEPLKEDGKLYMIPVEFQIPLIAGHENDLKSVDSYEEIADVVENLRKENSGMDLIGKCSETGVLKSFASICAPSWKDEKGIVQAEKIKEYLMISKRIYAAQMDGISEKTIEDYDARKNRHSMMDGEDYEDSTYFHRINTVDYLTGSVLIAYGTANMITDVAEAFSLARIKGLEDTAVKNMNGQSRNVYLPKTLTAINAATANKEKAVLFIKALYGKEVQGSVSYGFPMTKKAMENIYDEIEQVSSDKGEYLWSALSDEDGNYVEWIIYVLDESQKKQLYDWIAQAKTPYIPDTVLEEAVYEEGTKYLSGAQDIDTTVENIMESTAIQTME